MLIKHTELNHADVITINKLKYVKDESLFTGINVDSDKVINKHLWFIHKDLCIGEFSLNQDIICLFNDGLEYFTKINNCTIEKQVANTISHEILHRVLFYQQGENACRDFDNIAKSLRNFGVY